jgi:hypothetical protein
MHPVSTRTGEVATLTADMMQDMEVTLVPAVTTVVTDATGRYSSGRSRPRQVSGPRGSLDPPSESPCKRTVGGFLLRSGSPKIYIKTAESGNGHAHAFW